MPPAEALELSVVAQLLQNTLQLAPAAAKLKQQRLHSADLSRRFLFKELQHLFLQSRRGDLHAHSVYEFLRHLLQKPVQKAQILMELGCVPFPRQGQTDAVFGGFGSR